MPPSVPDKIPCHSAKDLRYALDPLRPLQEQLETEENWDKISRAIQTIAALTRGGAAELDAEYIKEIRGFSTLILNSMNSERTRLANIAVDLFTVILPPLGNKFEPFIGVFVPTLIKLLGRTNKVFISRATAGLHAIISHSPHPRIFVELRVMVSDKSAPLRVLVAGAVLLCLTEWDWSTPSLAAKAGDIETVIRAFGTDSNVDVRKITRQIFDRYKQAFPDRVDSFLEPLTPVIKRYLDIKAKSSQDKAPAPKKQAPVPAPQFKAAVPAPAPAPAPALPAQEISGQPVEERPRPKMTRVGIGRPGPSRAPVIDSHAQAPSAPTHSRIVSGPERIMSGPERIMSQTVREPAPDVHAPAGPMRAAVPSSTSSAPVMRSVSTSGPSRMRVDHAAAPLPPSAFDAQPLAFPQSTAEPGRRFRPARAPMDPSQMPQRVAVPPPAPKPTIEPKKPDGPSRVNLGSGVRSVSGPAAPPTRVAGTITPVDHPLKTSLTAPTMSESAPPSAVEPPQTPVLNEPSEPLPSPASVPIPQSAPTSRPASTIPPESRPPSVASNATSKAPTVTSMSTDTAPALDPASKPIPPAAPVKPTLTTSKSAPITTKVSALIKRGNPYAPPPFVPKRAPASGGVSAGTASQMARQREAIAAREKREAEEATKRTKKEAGQKKEAKEGKKPTSSNAPATSSRSRSASSQTTSSRNVPAAPRKRTVSTRAKPPSGPPKVDIKSIEPEMVTAVCAPLPGSPTPLAVREVPLPHSPAEKAENPDNADVEVMVLDAEVERDVEMKQAVQEPSTEEPTPTGTQDVPIPPAEPERMVIEISDDSSEVDMDEHEEPDEPVTERDTQTPPRTTPISLIDQTPAPAGTTPPLPPTGFAFHPQLAQLMALPPQPVQEVDDFLVDLSSPAPKERPIEKDNSNRMVLADRGNTHTYLSQFTQDLMSLSGL